MSDMRVGISGEDRERNAYHRSGVSIEFGDVGDRYNKWESPVAIIVDGPYGVGGFPGDPPTPEGLAAWYEPHIAAWSLGSTPMTTLWFWNTELGWANVHPVLQRYGWRYRSCHIWDKGMAHAAGNSNTKSLRKFPVVSEVCVQYTREAEFDVDGETLGMQDWLRHEWKRSGLAFYRANEACGVKNAATRKYLTPDHLWYYPPPEAFAGLVEYATKYGDPNGRPYFSLDGVEPLTAHEWSRMRAKFSCDLGVTNVWREPAVRGIERLKSGLKCLHTNQKPLKLIERIIVASTDVGDLVWEPFGGLCSGAAASLKLGRRCHSCEIIRDYFEAAVSRLEDVDVADVSDEACTG